MKTKILNERGSAIIFIAISMVVLIGFGALAVDVGLMTYHKGKLQNAVDAAALAGAHEIPESTTQGGSVAQEYLANNGEDVASLVSHNIYFEQSNKKIVVEATYRVDFFFAGVMGKDSADISVRAAAINAPTEKMSEGLRPFGVLYEDTQKSGLVHLQINPPGGDKDKDGEPDEVGPGNTGTVGLDYNGKDTGNAIEDATHYGTTKAYSVGDFINTEPGVSGGNMKKGLEGLFDDYGDEVIITIPIVNTLGVAGRSETVKIIGFAGFRVRRGDNLPYGKIVVGEFVDYVLAVGVGDMDGTDYGVRSVNLVE